MARRFEDRKAAREAGRKGGHAKAAKMRAARGGAPEPFAGTILDAMDAAELTGPAFAAWRCFWKAVTGIPLSDDELTLYRRCTERQRVPKGPLRSVWCIVGRRGGKSRCASALYAMWQGIRADYSKLHLAPGETCKIPIVAADKVQAAEVLAYVKGLARLPGFAPYVRRILTRSIELRTGCAITVYAASKVSTRGFTAPGVVVEELAFWNIETTSANPDREILTALKPAMLTIPGALLLACSTPYASRGELHAAYVAAYGKDDEDTRLVWQADNATMHPDLDATSIAQAYEDDPAAAAAEHGAQFRTDVEALLSREAVQAVTVPGRLELPPEPRTRYVAFADPSGGSMDSFTLAIAHREGARGVLDLVRERRPPFSPDAVVSDFAKDLAAYGLSAVTGDRYAGAWCAEVFRKHGITYRPSERTKSELYKELLPAVNAGRVELLDLPRLFAQLVALERRVAWGGKDSIDHPPGGHDDCANSVAGTLILADMGDGEWEIPVDPTVPALPDLEGAA